VSDAGRGRASGVGHHDRARVEQRQRFHLVGSDNDLVELMDLAAMGKVTLHITTYALDDINTAIDDLVDGRLRGRGILVP